MNNTYHRAHLGVFWAAALIVATPTAQAHHSFAAYDTSKMITVEGTIKEFRWGSPHSAVIVDFVDKDGAVKTVFLLSGSPLAFVKQGFNPRSFPKGEKVLVGWHPNRNGSLGGSVALIKFSDGKEFQDTEFSSPSSNPPHN